MKYLIGILCLFLAVSCSSEDSNESSTSGTTTSPANINTSPPSALNNQPATTATAVAHYVCPKGCAGGTGVAQGPCPVCGTAMEHNQAFHNNQPAAQINTTPGASGTPIISTQPQQQQQTAPAQNAQGVWHYTCSNGCAGGAGSAIACAACGTPLVHNQSYHN